MTDMCLIASLSDYEQNMRDCWRDKEMNWEWRYRSEVLADWVVCGWGWVCVGEWWTNYLSEILSSDLLKA